MVRVNSVLKAIEKPKIEDRGISQLTALLSNKHKFPNFNIFLAYIPILIFFLAVGVLLWHFQRTTEKDLQAVRWTLYSMESALTRMETRIDELQKLTVETKVSKNILEEQLNKLSREIATLDSNRTSAAIRSSVRRFERNNLQFEKQSFHHEVRGGDTLYSIAKGYGVSLRQLMLTNNIVDKDNIYAGQKILIISGNRDKTVSSTE
jgi:LysM repeat protein